MMCYKIGLLSQIIVRFIKSYKSKKLVFAGIYHTNGEIVKQHIIWGVDSCFIVKRHIILHQKC